MFRDREEAGRALGLRLLESPWRDRLQQPDGAIVLGLPRGGVPVARAVADVLGLPLDILLVRKLGVPWQPELAFGAIAEGGVQALDARLIRDSRLSAASIAAIVEREAHELSRRAKAYRGPRPAAEVRGRIVIVVDDGLATGSTMLAAVRVLRQRSASHIVVAAPVGSQLAAKILRAEADDVVCLAQPEPFYSVGDWYRDFHQTTDREVLDIIGASAG